MQLNNTAFKALYGLVGSIFPNNTTQEISAADMRQFGEDIADSFANIVSSLFLTTRSVSTSGGTLTLNFANIDDTVFYGDASFGSAKEIVLSNDTKAIRFVFTFEVSDVAAVITFPSSFVMSDIRWDSGSKEWTPDGTGLFKAQAIFNGSNWFLEISNVFV